MQADLEEEEEERIVPAWKFLGGLDLKDGPQIRRVMDMINHRTGNSHNRVNWMKARYNWRLLGHMEREKVNVMLRQTKGNYLLYDMLCWFGSRYKVKKNEDIFEAVGLLNKKVTFQVREREKYIFEYNEQKEEWIKFRGPGWNSAKDRDDEGEPQGSSTVPPPRKTYEQTQAFLATLEIDYVNPARLDISDDYISSDEEDEIEIIEERKVAKKNTHNYNPISNGGTRSGKVAGSVQEEGTTSSPKVAKKRPSRKKVEVTQTPVIKLDGEDFETRKRPLSPTQFSADPTVTKKRFSRKRPVPEASQDYPIIILGDEEEEMENRPLALNQPEVLDRKQPAAQGMARLHPRSAFEVLKAPTPEPLTNPRTTPARELAESSNYETMSTHDLDELVRRLIFGNGDESIARLGLLHMGGLVNPREGGQMPSSGSLGYNLSTDSSSNGKAPTTTTWGVPEPTVQHTLYANNDRHPVQAPPPVDNAAFQQDGLPLAATPLEHDTAYTDKNQYLGRTPPPAVNAAREKYGLPFSEPVMEQSYEERRPGVPSQLPSRSIPAVRELPPYRPKPGSLPQPNLALDIGGYRPQGPKTPRHD